MEVSQLVMPLNPSRFFIVSLSHRPTKEGFWDVNTIFSFLKVQRAWWMSSVTLQTLIWSYGTIRSKKISIWKYSWADQKQNESVHIPSNSAAPHFSDLPRPVNCTWPLLPSPWPCLSPTCPPVRAAHPLPAPALHANKYGSRSGGSGMFLLGSLGLDDHCRIFIPSLGSCAPKGSPLFFFFLT